MQTLGLLLAIVTTLASLFLAKVVLSAVFVLIFNRFVMRLLERLRFIVHPLTVFLIDMLGPALALSAGWGVLRHFAAASLTPVLYAAVAFPELRFQWSGLRQPSVRESRAKEMLSLGGLLTGVLFFYACILS